LQNHVLRIVSGGTDNHLILVDLRPIGITGNVAEKALEEAGIIVNKNLIPFDPEKPTITSGIRVGTPALTTRGMKEGEMEYIADLIAYVLKNIERQDIREEVRGKVRDLCEKFPIYKDLLEEYRKVLNG
jgi:glycine hydroxymethyltransferase